MLEIIIIVLAVIIAIILCFLGWIAGGYNVLLKGMQNIKTMFSDLLTEYQRRADLFYNLVEATKSHAKFEKDTLTQVIAMRNANNNLGNMPKKDAMKKMAAFDGLLSKLMVVVEKYPTLRSTEQYQLLMKETRITEDRINIARTSYNDTVRDYNLFVVSFPSNILAGMFHFKEEIFFVAEQEAMKSPKSMITIKCKSENGFLSFKCPWCNKIHHQGRGEGGRASHCLVHTQDYYLIEDKQLQEVLMQ